GRAGLRPLRARRRGHGRGRRLEQRVRRDCRGRHPGGQTTAVVRRRQRVSGPRVSAARSHSPREGDPVNQQDLRTLVDYHYWARDRLLDALEPLTAEQLTRDMGNSFKSIHQTVVHVYAAEWAWYERWHGVSPTALLSSEQFPDLASIRRAWSEHEVKMRAYVD